MLIQKESKQQIKRMQNEIQIKDNEISKLQQSSNSHKLIFVADNETVAAQYKAEVEKNSELQKQLDYLALHKKMVTDSTDNVNKRLYKYK